ncbi:MAG: hypothetical protein ACRENE_23210 [Polyangiaceae bacterium]
MGKWGWLALAAPLLSLVSAGCGAAFQGVDDDDFAALKGRASFDFDCPKSQIKTVTIDDRTKGVSGCGHRATYVQSCERVGTTYSSDCTWVMNNSSKHQSEDDEE